MDKKILADYIDACELIRETEEDIRKLDKKKKTIIQTNVSGSNPDFPFEKKHFLIEGTTFTYQDDSQFRYEERLLRERKANAERIKRQAEAALNLAPVRIQRIYRYRIIKRMKWDRVAEKMGGKCTGESVRKEFERFFSKK